MTTTAATATTIFARNSNVNSSGNNIRHNIDSEKKNSNQMQRKLKSLRSWNRSLENAEKFNRWGKIN